MCTLTENRLFIMLVHRASYNNSYHLLCELLLWEKRERGTEWEREKIDVDEKIGAGQFFRWMLCTRYSYLIFVVWYQASECTTSGPEQNSFCHSWTTANSMEFLFVKSFQVALCTPSFLSAYSALFTRRPCFCVRFSFSVSSDKMAVYGLCPLCGIFMCNSLRGLTPFFHVDAHSLANSLWERKQAVNVKFKKNVKILIYKCI